MNRRDWLDLIEKAMRGEARLVSYCVASRGEKMDCFVLFEMFCSHLLFRSVKIHFFSENDAKTRKNCLDVKKTQKNKVQDRSLPVCLYRNDRRSRSKFLSHNFLCKGFMQCFAKKKRKKKADLTNFRIDSSTCPVRLNKT